MATTGQFHDHENESGPVFNPIKDLESTATAGMVGEYKKRVERADGHHRFYPYCRRNQRDGNKYVVGVRNMLSPADLGPELLEAIKEHFPQDVK